MSTFIHWLQPSRIAARHRVTSHRALGTCLLLPYSRFLSILSCDLGVSGGVAGCVRCAALRAHHRRMRNTVCVSHRPPESSARRSLRKGPDAGTSNAERPYRDAIDKQLASIVSEPIESLSPYDVFVRMRGAFPSIVWSRLDASARENLNSQASSGIASQQSECIPELHPLDFEWYFTPECAATLVDITCSRRASTLCLGTPTVAASAVQRGLDAVLVDRNPLVVRRFPTLLRSSQLWLLDVAEAERHLHRSEVVLFDAPWYVEDACYWFALAIRLTKANGLIAFPLFPSLVRPSAGAEREFLLGLAADVGRVTLLENAISYETPVFESEALRATGISGFGNWRRGDLVIVRKRATPGNLPSIRRVREGDSTWRTYVLGRRVVKFRYLPGSRSPCNVLLQPIPGTADFVYPSVSARDHRRRLIDLWTSRNRVARITDHDSMDTILESLERGMHLPAAIREVYPSASIDMRARLEATLTCVFG